MTALQTLMQLGERGAAYAEELHALLDAATPASWPQCPELHHVLLQGWRCRAAKSLCIEGLNPRQFTDVESCALRRLPPKHTGHSTASEEAAMLCRRSQIFPRRADVQSEFCDFCLTSF